MPGALFSSMTAVGAFGGTVTFPDQYPYDAVNGIERLGPTWIGNENQVALNYWSTFDAPSQGVRPPEVGTGIAAFFPSQLTDFWFRFWVIPSSLNLSNPTVGADIPFTIWNTFPTPETLSAINVVGSSVLTFDLSPGAVIKDSQYLLTNLQIGAGEPTIDAVVNFVFESGTGILNVRALVASTFSIIPEVPVNEIWAFKTDTLLTWNGYESRLSLMENPRVSLDMQITLVDFADRRALYELVISAIRVPSLVPLFQYASPITADTLIGNSRLYFDTTLANVRVGVYVAVMNRVTQEVVLGRVNTVYADGVDIDSAVGLDILADPPLWFALPALPCYLEDQTGITFGTQAGTFSLQAQSLEEFDLVRPGSTRTVTTFDSLPVLEWPNLITTEEKFSYRRDLMDGGVGARVIRSRDIPVTVNRSFKFSASRLNDDLDYFRTFFATVRGSQKPFLVTTQLPDLIFTAPITQGGSSFTLSRADYVSKMFPFDAFKRIEIVYTNGEKSYHNVTSAAVDEFGVATITIAPGLVDAPEYTLISRVSYLQKCKASDTVTLEHYNDYTYVKFKGQTVEY